MFNFLWSRTPHIPIPETAPYVPHSQDSQKPKDPHCTNPTHPPHPSFPIYPIYPTRPLRDDVPFGPYLHISTIALPQPNAFPPTPFKRILRVGVRPGTCADIRAAAEVACHYLKGAQNRPKNGRGGGSGDDDDDDSDSYGSFGDGNDSPIRDWNGKREKHGAGAGFAEKEGEKEEGKDQDGDTVMGEGGNYGVGSGESTTNHDGKPPSRPSIRQTVKELLLAKNIPLTQPKPSAYAYVDANVDNKHPTITTTTTSIIAEVSPSPSPSRSSSSSSSPSPVKHPSKKPDPEYQDDISRFCWYVDENPIPIFEAELLQVLQDPTRGFLVLEVLDGSTAAAGGNSQPNNKHKNNHNNTTFGNPGFLGAVVFERGKKQSKKRRRSVEQKQQNGCDAAAGAASGDGGGVASSPDGDRDGGGGDGSGGDSSATADFSAAYDPDSRYGYYKESVAVFEKEITTRLLSRGHGAPTHLQMLFFNPHIASRPSIETLLADTLITFMLRYPARIGVDLNTTFTAIVPLGKLWLLYRLGFSRIGNSFGWMISEEEEAVDDDGVGVEGGWGRVHFADTLCLAGLMWKEPEEE